MRFGDSGGRRDGGPRLRARLGLDAERERHVRVDRYSLETSRPKFYAGGDVVTGASNVSNAMGYGKKAARKIDERLMGVKRFATALYRVRIRPRAAGESEREPAASRRGIGGRRRG